MKLDEIVAWYQKKIGAYDKQEWEKTVEQKIIDGFSSVTLKDTKLKTELIDVDLVRGSSFPKAKPKQSHVTVIRLAILRCFLLPLYAKWWVRQTSPNIFALLLSLYLAQLVSLAVYAYNVNRPLELNSNATLSSSKEYGCEANAPNEFLANEHAVSLMDLFIPIVISLLLSLIHSQIVATNSLNNIKPKLRRFPAKNSNTRPPRLRKRKKLVRSRSQEDASLNSLNNAGQQRKRDTITKTLHNQNPSLEEASFNKVTIAGPNEQHTLEQCLVEVKDYDNESHSECANNGILNPKENSNLMRKRNVNWNEPLLKYAVETQEKQQQTSPQTDASTSETSSAGMQANAHTHSSSSSSSFDNNPTTAEKQIEIQNGVQEFYEALVKQVDESETSAQVDNAAQSTAETLNVPAKRHMGDDDGFESLNGKSSSGEDFAHPHQMLFLPKPNVNNRNQVLRQRLTAKAVAVRSSGLPLTAGYRRLTPLSSESDIGCKSNKLDMALNQSKSQQCNAKDHRSSDDTDEEDGDDTELMSCTTSPNNNSNNTECTTSATEWLGVTTNTDECSYSSEFDSDDYMKHAITDDDGYDLDFTPTTILNPHGTAADRISCTIWERGDVKKAQMTVFEIASCIIERVESMSDTNDYIYIGVLFSVILTFVPSVCRLCDVSIDSNEVNYLDVPKLVWEKASFSFLALFHFAFGNTTWERTVLILSCVQRFALSFILFIIFNVAERTFKQRFLYAKLFSHLTSSRRARKSNLPHFRLNKVRNIKTWLSVRSYLKKRGPQRSVDVIVSAAFIVTLLLLSFLSLEWLKDNTQLHSHLILEALIWSCTTGIFLLRFMTLGSKIHQKYRCVSVLITEQINLYLQIEQKPKKKDELMVANSVLKLAADLLKELETPFKISGLSANPYLFTTIKVVILSALSGVLSEMLGFKLKLHKIKIK